MSCASEINPANALLVCIDSTKATAGRVYCRYLRAPLEFCGMEQFIAIADDFYDAVQDPKPFVKERTFCDTIKTYGFEKEQVMSKEEMLENTGKECTFVIHVTSRQNATWQGKIHWAEKDVTKNFRSALEMVKLIDSALGDE